MGAILSIILAVFIYGVKILNNSRNLTFDKWCEIFISFFIFTNCLNFGLTLFKIDEGMAYTNNIRIEVYMIILPIFFIVLARRLEWKLPHIHWLLVAFLVVFSLINIFNPANINRVGTCIALFNIFSYLFFLYILTACTKTDVIIKGVYEGFTYALILQAITVFIFAIGIHQIATFFREDTSIRSELRPGAPGTFSHPNPLGIYLSYLYCFFLSCYILGYNKKKSLFLAILTVATLIPTYSRSALMSVVFASIIIVSLYKTLHTSIFSPKNILTRILPMLVLAVVLVLVTPLRNSFIGSDMDEMMLARLLHFYFGLLVFVQNPVLGVGINSHVQYMTANFNFRSLGEINLVYDTFLFYYPVHNIWIIWLAEFGVLGTLLVIAFFVYKFLKIKPTLRSNIICENKIAAMTSIGVICCFLVQGMADPSHLSMHLSQVWMLFFFLSTAPHCRISLPDEKEENPPPLPPNK